MGRGAIRVTRALIMDRRVIIHHAIKNCLHKVLYRMVYEQREDALW